MLLEKAGRLRGKGSSRGKRADLRKIADREKPIFARKFPLRFLPTEAERTRQRKKTGREGVKRDFFPLFSQKILYRKEFMLYNRSENTKARSVERYFAPFQYNVSCVIIEEKEKAFYEIYDSIH